MTDIHVNLHAMHILIHALEEIGIGRCIGSCVEKRAQGYTAQVMLAREAIKEFEREIEKLALPTIAK